MMMSYDARRGRSPVHEGGQRYAAGMEGIAPPSMPADPPRPRPTVHQPLGDPLAGYRPVSGGNPYRDRQPVYAPGSASMPAPVPVPPVQPVYIRTNHTFHLLASLVTCGAWLFVWPFVALANSAGNARSRRLYKQALASYQQAVWAGKRSPGWRHYGDPAHGYRPAAGPTD